MNAPDSGSALLPVSARPPFLPSRGIAWWGTAVVVAVLTAWLTMQSVQLGCTLTLLVLAVGLYVRNRTAGLAVVWAVWLIAPFLRRLFLLSEQIQTAEPLALAPFLLTAAIVVLELSQVDLTRRARRLVLLLVGGYTVGLPVALLYLPKAGIFAYFAYLTAVGCFVIGYREAELRRLVLPTLLMIVTPLLALYAYRQYYLPLPKWDFVWQRTADFNSIGAPENGRIRVWSTLNSPGTFALVLGTAALALVTWRRLTPLKLLAAMSIFGALALTYVRSAWVSLVLALIAIVVVTRGSAVKRLIPVGVVLVALAPVILSGSTGAALAKRFTSFGALSSDESAQARKSAPTALFPIAAQNPIGTGLGSAGEPSRLNSQDTALRYSDNGWLALVAQVGPVGFLVVVSVVIAAIVAAWRNAWRRVDSTDVLVFGVLAFMFVSMFAGDLLYGMGGMIFWYMAGVAVRRRELSGGRV